MPERSDHFGQGSDFFQKIDEFHQSGGGADFGAPNTARSMANVPDSNIFKPKTAEKVVDKDENGVPKELWPYRDEMMQWINQEGRYNDLVAFLQYRKNTKFKLIAGMGFYHAPLKNIISIDVVKYKEMREGRGMTPAQIMFGAMHEFAHLKTMGELDLAGKYNELEQFNYEKKKGYFIRDEKGEKVRMSAQSAYRQYYNINEDAIVNSLVFNTGIYGKNVTEKSRRNNQEVVDLYTDQFFPVYLEVGDNNGDYIYRAELAQLGQKPLVNVGEGKGNIRVATKEDYDRGFDWNKAVPKMGRTGQFVTYFMKNQMIGLSAAEVYDGQTNREGKHILNEDVGIVFTRPLSFVYKTLLARFVEKYKNDPDKMSLYLDFMSDQIKVPLYEVKNGKKCKVKDEIYVNVAEVGRSGPIYPGYQKIDINFATQLFEKKIRDALMQLGLPIDFSKITSVKYLDIFNQFKELDRSRNVFGTKPLKKNLVARTRIMRNVLEPIYSLLCVLDDSFKTELPPEPNSGDGDRGGEDGEPPEIEDEPDWQPGDKVRNKDPESPNHGKKGVVTKVHRGEKGVLSVEVEYYEEDNMMAEGLSLAGITETITDPVNQKLKIIKKKGKQKSQSSGQKDIRDTEYEEDEKEKDDEDDDENNDEGDKDGQDDESDQPSEPRPDSEPKTDDHGNKEDEPLDLDEVLSGYEKALREMIDQDEREESLQQVEAEKRSADYQKKKLQNDKFRRLLEEIKKNQPEDKDEGDEDKDKKPLPPETVIRKFIELEDRLRVPANKMAEAWLQIIKNISRKIDTIVDKYYRQGKPDIKKLQRLLPEIEYGMDVDRRLIHKLIIERVLAELKPNMLKTILVVDNSGSMSGYLDAIRMIIMLTNSSLRNFRKNFREVIGGAVTEKADEMDVVCDTEIWLFGDKVDIAKASDITDFSFLTDKSKFHSRPSLLDMVERETISTILAFEKINASYNDTRDALVWAKIALAHDSNPQIKELLKQGYLSEMIFQISDGDNIKDSEVDSETGQTVNTFDAIRYMRENYAVGIGAMGIGKKAVDALKIRHGEDVIGANTPDEIANNFCLFLTRIIENQVEKPMMAILEKIENSV